MNIGALIRTEARGLGIQSQAFQRHMNAKPLLIDIPNRSAKFCPADWTLYPDVPRARVGAGWQLPELLVRKWLENLDVVWTAETFYDDRFADWAREAGAATVIHANPEFVTRNLRGYGFGRPSRWWSATNWRLDRMPAGTEVMPWPAEVGEQTERHGGRCRFLFVGGRTAMGDRNGLGVLLEALGMLVEPCEVTICSQDRAVRVVAPDHVQVSVLGNQSTLPYVDHDVLVMPRRYGGLCLPVIEAMGHGLAVLMPDVPPNLASWPVASFRPSGWTKLNMAGGEVEVATFDPVVIAGAMDAFADVDHRWAWQDEAVRWAWGNRWEVVGPRWAERMKEIKP